MLTSPPLSRPSSPQPRVDHCPPFAFTFGPEAAAFARSAGLNPDDWQEDSVDRILGVGRDGRWSCPEYAEFVARQNGKGAILEVRVLFGFFLLGEKEIVWSAHLYATSLKAFGRIKALIKALGTQVGDNENLIAIPNGDQDDILVKINNTNGYEGFTRLDNGAVIQFVARSKNAARGFTGDLLIIDEAFAFTDEQQEAMLPTLSARSMEIPGPQIIYTSSPPLTAESDKVVFRLKDRAESGDETLAFRDWGLAGDLENLGDIDFTDRALWRATNPALGRRISEAWVAREMKAMSERGFARERLGVWPPPPESTDDKINFELWKSLRDALSQLGTDIALAIDVTPARDWAAIVAYGPSANGRGHVEVIEHRQGTDWIVARLLELKLRWNPIAIALDTKGPAGSLLLELDDVGISLPSKDDDGKRVEPRRGDLIIPTANDYAGACGSIVDAITQLKIVHIDQIPLNSAIGGAATRPLGDAWAWARKTSTANIAPLVAATLARWGFLARINALAAPAPPPATASVPPMAGTAGGANELWRPTSRLDL